MAMLPHTHPDVYAEFESGKFVVQRGDHKFSMMALDQSQEHSIKFLKEASGPRGLYGRPDEKEVLEVSRGEVLRIVQEYEKMTLKTNKPTLSEHREGSQADQTTFRHHLQAMIGCVEAGTIVSPFKETTPELVTLDTREIMDPAVQLSLRSAIEKGKEMFQTFVKERLVTSSKPLTGAMSRVNPLTFSNRPAPGRQKASKKDPPAKANESLVTKLFMSLQAQQGADLNDFFRHENRREPPSLSTQGQLSRGCKSAIINCLPCFPEPGPSREVKEASVLLFDMPAVVHIIKPDRAKVFEDYMAIQVIPFLLGHVGDGATRIDAIWDTYSERSLKSQAREQRANGTIPTRTRVEDKIPIPRDWQKFLLDSSSKKELYPYLSEKLINLCTEKTNVHVISTHGTKVLSSRNDASVSAVLGDCDHEEADTRIFYHLQHAAKEGHAKAYIRTVDSDIVVLAIHHFSELQISKLWIGFGVGKQYKVIRVHDVVQELGPDRCQSLPFLHAFSGCDVTSSLKGVGKKTVWTAWSASTSPFVEASQWPPNLELCGDLMRKLSRRIYSQALL
jgi:hypothetical protein